MSEETQTVTLSALTTRALQLKRQIEANLQQHVIGYTDHEAKPGKAVDYVDGKPRRLA